MHGLDVIIARNTKAAARANAHAYCDEDHERATRIALANIIPAETYQDSVTYDREYLRARYEER